MQQLEKLMTNYQKFSFSKVFKLQNAKVNKIFKIHEVYTSNMKVVILNY